jgi:hypothetical protein
MSKTFHIHLDVRGLLIKDPADFNEHIRLFSNENGKHLEKIQKLPELPNLKPAKRKIEVNSNPNRDFFRRELGLV